MNKTSEQLSDRFGKMANRVRPTLASQPTKGAVAGRTRDPEACILDIDRIIPDPEQVRQTNKGPDDPETKQLADSIRAIGIQQSLKVRFDKEQDIFVIIAGERRYHAAKLAGLTSVPCKIADVDAETAAQIQLHENIHRKDLSALEIGASLCKMLDDGMSYAELVTLTNKGKPWVSRHVNSYKKLTPEARDLALQHRLQLEHLYEIARLTEDQQVPMLRLVVADGLSRTQIQEMTADKKKVAAGSGGRTKKTRPYSKAIKVGPAVVTVKFSRQRASLDDVENALRDALEQVAEVKQKAA